MAGGSRRGSILLAAHHGRDNMASLPLSLIRVPECTLPLPVPVTGLLAITPLAFENLAGMEMSVLLQ